MKKALGAALALMLVAPLPAVAAELVVEGGRLNGATGVVVGANTYDVEFLDGTCAALFSGCNSASDFAFTDAASALAAAQALIDQVFVDGPAGAFDSQPELTRGCGAMGNGRCYAIVPYGGIGQSVFAAYADNTNLFDDTFIAPFGADLNSSDYPGITFARFVPSAAVPEPATWAMMIGGFGLVGGAMRRGRSRFLAA